MPTFTQLQDILLEPSVIQCAKGISQVLLKAHSVSSNGTERVTFGSSHPLQVNFELLMVGCGVTQSQSALTCPGRAEQARDDA